MSYSPPPSPPLPTFAIKDLCGPSNPPGLISISKRRYDATLKSAPNAALLYLDDDDGELITVGSGLELSQRLEEPVPKYIRELRNPADGKLVHVFDINHSLASLIEWRDHEAYSSKRFNSISPSLQSPRSESELLAEYSRCSFPDPVHVPYPDLPEPRTEESTTIAKDDSTAAQKETPERPLDILSGIEEHLSGLANVLQIAANTLQRAADKTKETDTSIVEDILKGVKGILTEVGSFGVEAFKELGTEIDAFTIEQSTPTTATASNKEAEAAARLARAAKQAYNARVALKKNVSPEGAPGSSTYHSVEGSAIKVKFAIPKFTKREAVVPPEATRPIPIHAQSARPEDSCKVNILKETPTSKYQHPSFLDDSSEDADFTARYPPLNSVRRTRSTIDRPFPRTTTYMDDVGLEKARAQREWQAKLDDEADASSPVSTQDDLSSSHSPFASPTPVTASGLSTISKPSSEEKVGNTDAAPKSLPGAWPDAKTDVVSTQPPPCESSGDFFNRMVGRRCPSRYRASFLDSGLHRANTTASSNPASRLNGPFDPGFPYDSSPSSSRRHGLSRPHRVHPFFAGPSSRRHNSAMAASPDHGTQPSLASETNSSPITVTLKAGTPTDTESQISAASSRSQFESHRAVKHHRSVPHFHGSSSMPYQIMRPRPVANHALRPAQRSATDFLSGPPMPMPPPMPFTTRPSFPPRPAPPNLWSPWQSSPPTQAPTNEGTNVSSMNDCSNNNDAGSPVSSESTVTRDFDIPNNEPPFPSAQPQSSSSESFYRYPTPPRPAPPTTSAPPPWRASLESPVPSALPTFWPPPPSSEPMQIEPVKDKIDECVEQLKMCGFGIDDDNLKNRLHVYAVAADGDVTEAVEMIEQDRRMTAPGRFD